MGIRNYILLRPKCAYPACNRTAHRISKAGQKPKFRSTCDYHHKNPIGRAQFDQWKMSQGCANSNGSVTGTPCTSTITMPGELHIDHIDGNKYNNQPSNHQVVCGNCHHVKGQINNDHLNSGTKECTSNFNDLFELAA